MTDYELFRSVASAACLMLIVSGAVVWLAPPSVSTRRAVGFGIFLAASALNVMNILGYVAPDPVPVEAQP